MHLGKIPPRIIHEGLHSKLMFAMRKVDVFFSAINFVRAICIKMCFVIAFYRHLFYNLTCFFITKFTIYGWLIDILFLNFRKSNGIKVKVICKFISSLTAIIFQKFLDEV